MEKKVNSNHMQNILNGLKQFEELEIVVFSEEIIFNEDIQDWPIVDAMIIFFSDGFPYNKGLKYVNLRKPFLINDFEMQKLFWDRRKVLEILQKEKIPIPNNVIIDRGEEINNDGEFTHKLNDSNEIASMIQRFESLENESYEMSPSLRSNTVNNNMTKELQNEEEQNGENDNFALVEIDNEIANNNDNNIGEESPSCSPKYNNEEDDIIEYDDHIVYKGKKMFKPFVEKPFNGDDHNIYIYYPPSHGGGHKRLFRKTKDLCSYFIPNINEVRRDKSYIYEEFLQTDGFDIKVYTIGPDYAHAEARKSPSLDGKVQRTQEGKEVRYPVNLTPDEKELARNIVRIFKQNICGFDILRAKGQSYVCDINGWSFVKGNKKYYEDCAILIRRMILINLNKELFFKNPIYLKQVPIYKALKLPRNQKEKSPYVEELRSVVAVFRHADRCPKQKMKLVVDNKEILSLFQKFGKKKSNNDNNENNTDDGNEQVPHFKEIKLKKPKELMEVLKIVTNLLEKNKIDESELNDLSDNFFTKLFQLKMVLEKNLNFEGMTRKIQMKPLKTDFKIIPGTQKKQYFVSEALMIIKWGGNITHAGIEQAKLLGTTFRVQMYPSNLGDGSGLLRLHSTYRHDLKCYSSDEGRCLKTAAAFLTGLLSLDGPLTPIITSMVRKDEPVSQCLDLSCEQIPEVKNKVKQEISDCLNQNEELHAKFDSLFEKSSIYDNGDTLLTHHTKTGSNISNLSGVSSNSSDTNTNSNTNIQLVPNLHPITASPNISNNKSDKLPVSSKYPLYDLMDNIGNPFERMKLIIELMDNIIEHIKSYLSPEEIELECNTYYIRNVTSIQKRPMMLKNLKNLSEEAEKYFLSQLENENEHDSIIEYNTIPSPRVNKQLISNKPSSNNNNNNSSIKKDKTNKNQISSRLSNNGTVSSSNAIPTLTDNKSETSSINQNNSSMIKCNTIHDCEDEKIILIFKRYIKLRKDFYNKKTNKFDISKVPDIYDNIKYDIIHNKSLLNDDAYSLFTHINLLANFVMPLEYGITLQEKMNIGVKIIGPLFQKIHKDLLWWNYNPYHKQFKHDTSDESYSGLDQSRVDSTEIKSTWRHVKTRFYFTCASHMYALLNILIYGDNSFLLDRTETNKKGLNELRNVFDLDYCSHIVFRLFENFNVGENDPKRFRLEMIMSPGSNKNPKDADKNHMINVSPWIVLNNNLTLNQMKEFFCKFEK